MLDKLKSMSLIVWIDSDAVSIRFYGEPNSGEAISDFNMFREPNPSSGYKIVFLTLLLLKVNLRSTRKR